MNAFNNILQIITAFLVLGAIAGSFLVSQYKLVRLISSALLIAFIVLIIHVVWGLASL